MAELVSEAHVPTVASLDSILANSSPSLALMAPSIRAILRRTKSTGYLSQVPDSQPPRETDVKKHADELARCRTASPVTANSRRRRSAAPVAEPNLETCSSSDIGSKNYSPPSRQGSVELGSASHRAFPSQCESESQTQSETTSTHSTHSRGRSRIRKPHDTPTPGDHNRDRSRQIDQQSNISKRRQHTQSIGTPPSRNREHSLSYGVDNLAGNIPSYVTKGVFRLHNHREEEEFRFPKSTKRLSNPNWGLGDGFSEDETSPEAAFGIIGKHSHKRKRSRSLSGLGKLSLEAEKAVRRPPTQLATSKPHPKGLNESRAAVDLWPTRENFTDSSIAKKRKTVVTKESQGEVPCTPPLHLRSRSMSRPAIRMAKPRMRQSSEFENFGKLKRRSQSRCIRETPPPSLGIPQQLIFQIDSDSDDEDESVTDESYEQARDNIEQLSLAENERYHTPMTTNACEVSDHGSVPPPENDPQGRDTEMEEAMEV